MFVLGFLLMFSFLCVNLICELFLQVNARWNFLSSVSTILCGVEVSNIGLFSYGYRLVIMMWALDLYRVSLTYVVLCIYIRVFDSFYGPSSERFAYDQGWLFDDDRG